LNAFSFGAFTAQHVERIKVAPWHAADLQDEEETRQITSAMVTMCFGMYNALTTISIQA
jgi:hypothetical protein